MNKQRYVNNCECQVNDEEFDVKLDNYPTHNISEDINSEMKSMLDNKLTDKKESLLLTEHFDKPRT